MSTLLVVIAVVVIVLLALLLKAVRIVKQYELGVLFRLGRVVGLREPGLRLIIPFRYGNRSLKAIQEITFATPGLPTAPLPG